MPNPNISGFNEALRAILAAFEKNYGKYLGGFHPNPEYMRRVNELARTNPKAMNTGFHAQILEAAPDSMGPPPLYPGEPGDPFYGYHRFRAALNAGKMEPQPIHPSIPESFRLGKTELTNQDDLISAILNARIGTSPVYNRAKPYVPSHDLPETARDDAGWGALEMLRYLQHKANRRQTMQ